MITIQTDQMLQTDSKTLDFGSVPIGTHKIITIPLRFVNTNIHMHIFYFIV